MKLYLRQTFSRPVMGAMGAGPYTTFDWGIDHNFSDGKSRIGSWVANYYFEVRTGRSDRDTLSHAKQALEAAARRKEEECSFEYIED